MGMSGETVQFDALDDLPDERAFQFALNHYWVIAFKHQYSAARPTDWLMSPGRPMDVPNGMMAWRRPTYQEFIDWMDWWSVRGEQPDGHLFQYRRTPDEVGVSCECGHDESSHHNGPLVGPGCRMTCVCRRYRPVVFGRTPP